MALRQFVFYKEGRPTMLEDGVALVTRGKTTLEELLRVVPYEQVPVPAEIPRSAAGE